MKSVIVGVHLTRDDVEPIAEAMNVADVWLSAVAIPDDRPLGDRDLLVRIARVRAELLDRATFIAVRYGFAVWSAAEALSKCGANVGRWKALLERHRDDVEMTLKVAAASPQPRPDRAQFVSGAEYLRALHASTTSAQVDDAFREAAERAMFAVEHRWIHRDNNSLELAALVPRARVGDALAAGGQLKRDFPHVAFLLSGPWPLEVFAS
jgi:spore maturation protein CgeB